MDQQKLIKDCMTVKGSHIEEIRTMARRHAFLFALGMISAISTGSASAQSAAEVNGNLDTLFGSHAPYQTFFDKLKKAVGSDDKATVAALVAYPFQARIKGKALKIKDQKQFLTDCDQIITPKVKGAVTKQTYATLFANWQGVSIGDGEIWFSGICSNQACEQQTIRITAIND
ncbi:hypothetical protein NKJ40_14385 [Mesorhizobium sp. M0119]|uniref:hypothetical protein n=1 Tax=Mesorhizobium sp. M0119 TaxID=2956885 RepID=UPI003337B065